MKPTQHSLAVVVALASVLATQPAVAQETLATPVAYHEDNSPQERIALSGKLRMLSQRIPAAACHLTAQIDPQVAEELLVATTAEFDQILKGLEFGDVELNINGAEPRAKTLAKIQTLAEAWAPIKAASEELVAGTNTDENLRVILEQDMVVLAAAKKLVIELMGEYSNPFEMVQSDAFLIDIAGRQRMLTQKMSKQSCMLFSDHAAPNTVEELQDSMRVFESSLQALRHGMPSAGIGKPPTAEISNGLEDALKVWADIQPLVQAAIDDPALDADRELKRFQSLNKSMDLLNSIVDGYTQAAKRES